jgi:hypothetical protein
MKAALFLGDVKVSQDREIDEDKQSVTWENASLAADRCVSEDGSQFVFSGLKTSKNGDFVVLFPR